VPLAVWPVEEHLLASLAKSWLLVVLLFEWTAERAASFSKALRRRLEGRMAALRVTSSKSFETL